MAPVKGKYATLPDDNLNDEFAVESPCNQCSKHRWSLVLMLTSLELANIVVVLLFWIGRRQGSFNNQSNCELSFHVVSVDCIFAVADRKISFFR